MLILEIGGAALFWRYNLVLLKAGLRAKIPLLIIVNFIKIYIRLVFIYDQIIVLDSIFQFSFLLFPYFLICFNSPPFYYFIII